MAACSRLALSVGAEVFIWDAPSLRSRAGRKHITSDLAVDHRIGGGEGLSRSGRRPGAARLAVIRAAAEDRDVDGTRGVVDVARERRAGAVGVARERRLDDLGMLFAQAPARDRSPQHGAVAIALRLVVEELGEAKEPPRRAAGNER